MSLYQALVNFETVVLLPQDSSVLPNGLISDLGVFSLGDRWESVCLVSTGWAQKTRCDGRSLLGAGCLGRCLIPRITKSREAGFINSLLARIEL